jgi:photosystem II stability/assembly factor-like uncharacterized protein
LQLFFAVGVNLPVERFWFTGFQMSIEVNNMKYGCIARSTFLGWAPIALVLGIQLNAVAQAEVTLTHVHGLTYSADGKRLFVPSHHGLAVYNDGHWSKAPGPGHDFMGFASTKKYFFSSGHPARGSRLTNPFGLIASSDGGRTWDQLGLEGQSDFHVLAAGYENNVIYVVNSAPNSKMDRAGIYYTGNRGLLWRRADAAGLSGGIAGLAVHPTDSKIVAAATQGGIFLSRDSGSRFESLLGGTQGLAVFFELDGRHLWASAYDGAPKLHRIALDDKRRESVSIPPLTRDAVAYIAQNPARQAEFAIATFERSVYLSRDRGKSWAPIADRGRGL